MKKIRFYILIVALMLVSLVAKATEKARLWDCYEIAMKCKTDKNPFTEVSLTATFTNSDTGKKITVDGFYDGDDTFRIRFMPMEPGTWTYTTAST